MRGRSLRERIMNGEVIVGTWVLSTNPAFAEIPGLLGFDFVYFDREHTSNSWETIEKLILASLSVDTPSIIRIEDNDPVNIRKTFELGAQGVLVPHVCTREDAESIVKAAKFPPLGIRGTADTVRSAGYHVDDMKKYLSESNKNTLVCALIEDKEAMENIEEIASVEGLDVLCFGAGDYSTSVGRPGEGIRANVVKEAFEEMIRVARKYKKAVWFSPASPTPEQVKELISKGVQILMIGNDMRAFYVSLREVMENVVNKVIRKPC